MKWTDAIFDWHFARQERKQMERFLRKTGIQVGSMVTFRLPRTPVSYTGFIDDIDPSGYLVFDNGNSAPYKDCQLSDEDAPPGWTNGLEEKPVSSSPLPRPWRRGHG